MTLLTKALREQLIKNHRNQDGTVDQKPVVKFFNPTGIGTWLITELDPDTNIMFGLCDLGTPEVGFVSFDELSSFRGMFGLGIERDMYWTADKTLGEYADEAYRTGRVAA